MDENRTSGRCHGFYRCAFAFTRTGCAAAFSGRRHPDARSDTPAADGDKSGPSCNPGGSDGTSCATGDHTADATSDPRSYPG